MLNCPNCAAPIDPILNKCPYCKTSYYDMSAIDFENNQPFYLKIKINGFYITQLVKPEVGTIEITSDPVYVYGGKNNNRLTCFEGNRLVSTQVNFTGIPNKNGTIMEIEKVI